MSIFMRQYINSLPQHKVQYGDVQTYKYLSSFVDLDLEDRGIENLEGGLSAPVGPVAVESAPSVVSDVQSVSPSVAQTVSTNTMAKIMADHPSVVAEELKNAGGIVGSDKKGILDTIRTKGQQFLSNLTPLKQSTSIPPPSPSKSEKVNVGEKKEVNFFSGKKTMKSNIEEGREASNEIGPLNAKTLLASQADIGAMHAIQRSVIFDHLQPLENLQVLQSVDKEMKNALDDDDTYMSHISIEDAKEYLADPSVKEDIVLDQATIAKNARDFQELGKVESKEEVKIGGTKIEQVLKDIVNPNSKLQPGQYKFVVVKDGVIVKELTGMSKSSIKQSAYRNKGPITNLKGMGSKINLDDGTQLFVVPK